MVVIDWNCHEQRCMDITSITYTLCAVYGKIIIYSYAGTSTHCMWKHSIFSPSVFFLQIRTGNTTQPNLCRERSYILVAVTVFTETCLWLSEIKEIVGTNTQSDAFQETLQQSYFLRFFLLQLIKVLCCANLVLECLYTDLSSGLRWIKWILEEKEEEYSKDLLWQTTTRETKIYSFLMLLSLTYHLLFLMG